MKHKKTITAQENNRVIWESISSLSQKQTSVEREELWACGLNGRREDMWYQSYKILEAFEVHPM